MSIMVHAAHGAARMSNYARKTIAPGAVNILSIDTGRYVMQGTTGNGTTAPTHQLTSAPIDFGTLFQTSLGYVIELDVDQIQLAAGGPIISDAMVSTGSKSLRRIVFTVYLFASEGSGDYYNSLEEQMVLQHHHGMMRWEAFITLAPKQGSLTGEVIPSFAFWVPLSANIARNRSLAPLRRDNKYYINLSLTNNWAIDNFNPASAIVISYNDGAAYPSALENFDGLVTITLNSIGSSGTPIIQNTGYNDPVWMEPYSVVAGKRARLVIDYHGRGATMFGIDLPAGTPLI